MTVEKIVRDYLERNGFDGLCCTDCGCDLSDLAPCGNWPGDCEPGYRVSCSDEPDDFIIVTEKPQKEDVR